MANKSISMTKLRKLIKLTLENKSSREIRNLTGMSRNTINKYQAVFKAHLSSLPELLELSDKELYSLVLPPSAGVPTHRELYGLFPKMEAELRRVGVTKLFLWEKYKAEHPSGVQYSRFCEHFNRYLKSQQLSYVFHHKAGDKMMVDFAGKKLHLTNPETGELTPVEFFVSILPFSGFTYGEACMSQQTPDFLGCVERSFFYFGGATQSIVPDNLKAAINRASKYDPEINKSMADFADHYDTAIVPTRAREPKDKALVESAVNILYTRIYAPLHDQVFFTLSELNKAIRILLDKHNDMLMQGREYSRRQRFEELEKHTLKTLPNQAFELRKYQQAKVQANCHVFLSEDKHFYSVPYPYVGKKVTLCYNSETVEVYCQYELIAIHSRLKIRHQYSTTHAHMHPHHQYYSNWSEQFFVDEGKKIGYYTCELMSKLMSQRKHPEQGFKSCHGILHLSKKYSAQRVENAAKLCIQYEFASYRKAELILSKGWDKIEFEDSEAHLAIIHENIRGQSYYQ